MTIVDFEKLSHEKKLWTKNITFVEMQEIVEKIKNWKQENESIAECFDRVDSVIQDFDLTEATSNVLALEACYDLSGLEKADWYDLMKKKFAFVDMLLGLKRKFTGEKK